MSGWVVWQAFRSKSHHEIYRNRSLLNRKHAVCEKLNRALQLFLLRAATQIGQHWQDARYYLTKLNNPLCNTTVLYYLEHLDFVLSSDDLCFLKL